MYFRMVCYSLKCSGRYKHSRIYGNRSGRVYVVSVKQSVCRSKQRVRIKQLRYLPHRSLSMNVHRLRASNILKLSSCCQGIPKNVLDGLHRPISCLMAPGNERHIVVKQDIAWHITFSGMASKDVLTGSRLPNLDDL